MSPLRVLMLLFAGVAATIGQSGLQLPPGTQPGDAVYYDPSNGAAYLWIHASDGSITTLNGYLPEQIYKLLVAREAAAWKANQQCATQLYSYTNGMLCAKR